MCGDIYPISHWKLQALLRCFPVSDELRLKAACPPPTSERRLECKSDGQYLTIGHVSLEPAEGEVPDSAYSGPVRRSSAAIVCGCVCLGEGGGGRV